MNCCITWAFKQIICKTDGSIYKLNQTFSFSTLPFGFYGQSLYMKTTTGNWYSRRKDIPYIINLYSFIYEVCCRFWSKHSQQFIDMWSKINGNQNTHNNSLKTTSSSTYIKVFRVNIDPTPRAPSMKEVIWHPLIPRWVKRNTDGASLRNPGISACGAIFRDNNANCLVCFAKKLSVASTFTMELEGVMKAIKAANSKGWRNLWI